MGAPMSRAVHGATAQLIRMLMDESVATGPVLDVPADMIQRVGGPFWSPLATGVLGMMWMSSSSPPAPDRWPALRARRGEAVPSPG
jgi:hypothetical protein